MTKPKVTPITQKLTSESIQTLSALLTRAQLAAQLGQSFGGERDIYQALGYDRIITYNMFASQYQRQAIARAVIDRPVSATWRRGFSIIESDDDKDTPFEKAWVELYERLQLRQRFARLDRLSGIGTYGILLLGLSDAQAIEDFAKPVTGVKHGLKYVRPFGGMALEGSAQISQYEIDTTNERYGQPLIYSIQIQDVASGASQTLRVHHTRIIHVCDGMLESEIEGTPRLQAVWNNLKNLEKIEGGSAEMFWRGARPGYQALAAEGANFTTTFLEDLQGQLDEYEHNLRRTLALQNVKMEAMTTQVSDPSSHVDIQIQMISAETGIPKRVLTGSEVGQLASSQDTDNWADKIESRRDEYAELSIIRQFVDYMIKLKILPPAGPDGYSVQWPSMRDQSEAEKAKIGVDRSTAIKNYASAPTASSVVPEKSFLRLCLGLDDDEIQLIEEELEAAMSEEAEAPETQLGEGEVVPVGPGGEVPANPKQDDPTVQGKKFNWKEGDVQVYLPKTNTSEPTVQGGNFGHAGRPGEVGGSAPSKGGGSESKDSGTLTDNEKESISTYQRNNYVEVNGHLRGNVHISAGDKAGIKDHVSNLDSAFRKASDSEINVYRGSDAEFTKSFFQKTGILKEMKEAKTEGITNIDKPPAGFSTWDKYFNTRLQGVTFQDKGFTSTSTSEKVALGFKSSRYEDPRNGVSSICNIRGTAKALDMNKITRDRVFADQKEMLLQRGNTYRIDGVKVMTDKSSNKNYLKFNVSII